LAAKKAVALGQDLEHTFTGEHDVLIEQFLLDSKDEILFAQPGRILDRVAIGYLLELRG
jgi:hypothetical protein